MSTSEAAAGQTTDGARETGDGAAVVRQPALPEPGPVHPAPTSDPVLPAPASGLALPAPSSGPAHLAPASDLESCLTRAFARSRVRGWLAASGSGLTLDLPQRLLVEEFGPQRVMRFEDVDFPPALTHEPTRRFLREVGLPEEATPFHLDTELPLPTLSGFHLDAEDRADLVELADPAARPARPALPESADTLIRLGRLADAHLVVDGPTGALHTWHPGDAHPHHLHADISTLAFALWLRRLEAPMAVA